MNHTFTGFVYFVEGFSLIAKPGLRRFVIIPLMINILIFIALFFIAGHFFNEFNQWFVAYLPTWLQWLSWLLWLVFFASFFLVMIYTFVMLANLVCAPFNSFLAEKTELYLTGMTPQPRTLFENIKDIPRIVGRQLSILGYYLPRALLLFILLFVPVVQLFAGIFLFLFHAWFMTMTYIDYPTDNHRVPINEVKTWLKQRRWVAMGFGISALVATMVPFLNLFIMPAAVAAATKFWVSERDHAAKMSSQKE